MDSFNQPTGFRYNPESSTMGSEDSDSEFSGILEILVHHARNIHNICIYDNQDVYAKFSLTYNPDETLSTQIINGGGKNPEFNENLIIKVTQLDAVLKCEIWMLSRVRNYLEDQLLGFTLVPISQVVGKGKVTQDYNLSSTDLFHSPAGIVKLSLSLNTSPTVNTPTNSSISSEVVLLDRNISEVLLDPVEYSRIEFPDISVVRENQKMVFEYFGGLNARPNSAGLASFLHLGASPQLVDDYEMTINSTDENPDGTISPNGNSLQNSSLSISPNGNSLQNSSLSISPNGSSLQNSGFLSSTTSSLSENRNSADSVEKKNLLGAQSSTSINEANQSSGTCPDTPTSKSDKEVKDEKESNFQSKEDKNKKEGKNISSAKFGPVFSAPMGNINLEAEQSAMQQQIVDMYMRSMQQFTESLGKMKLPMDLDKPECEDRGDLVQDNNNKLEIETKKKDGSRVFYGSRAFF